MVVSLAGESVYSVGVRGDVWQEWAADGAISGVLVRGFVKTSPKWEIECKAQMSYIRPHLLGRAWVLRVGGFMNFRWFHTCAIETEDNEIFQCGGKRDEVKTSRYFGGCGYDYPNCFRPGINRAA